MIRFLYGDSLADHSRQLARNETQLQPIKNTHLNGLVKLEVILLPALIEIERKYING